MDQICAICGKKADHIHHIIYRSRWAEGEDVPENQILLCANCHMKVHNRMINIPQNRWEEANRLYGRWLEEHAGISVLKPARSRRRTNLPPASQSLSHEQWEVHCKEQRKQQNDKSRQFQRLRKDIINEAIDHMMKDEGGE